MSKLDLAAMSLQDLEQHTGGLDLLGFAVMSNQLRPDSKATIEHLQNE